MREAEEAFYKAIRLADNNLENLRQTLSDAETAWLTHAYTCILCRKSPQVVSDDCKPLGAEARKAGWSITEYASNPTSWIGLRDAISETIPQ
jgi:hypothetical protein